MKDKFTKIIDYDKLKLEYGTEQQADKPVTTNDTVSTDDTVDSNTATHKEKATPGLTGARLRSYAFAKLTRKEYSKQDLIDKLCLYAASKDEVIALVNELANENYQSDQRVAEMVVRSQVRQGKGPNRIKLALKSKHVDHTLAQHEMEEVDWYEEAYALKVKKYGEEVTTDLKLKAKQVRFLQYRGFDMSIIMKVINRKAKDKE